MLERQDTFVSAELNYQSAKTGLGRSGTDLRQLPSVVPHDAGESTMPVEAPS